MNRNQLKMLAAVAMLFDHLGYIFIPIRTPFGLFCRIFGRLTAPIMCYFLAEGFHYTSSKKKYLLRLGIFALIAQPAYSMAFHGVWLGEDLSMLYTLFLSFLMLCAWEGIENPWLKYPAVLGLIVLCHFGDWTVVAPLWVLGFHLFRGKPGRQFALFILVALGFTAESILESWGNFLPGGLPALLAQYPLPELRQLLERFPNWKYNLVQLATLLAIPLLLCYNGQKGRGGAFSKWFFYVFYPGHLYLFAFLRTRPELVRRLLNLFNL